MSLNQELHDRLWRAFHRWGELRQTGVTKHEIKMRGIRESGDPNLHMRNIIFTGNTLRSYEGVLKAFVEHAQREHGAQRLEDAGNKALRSFMDRAIEKGLSVKTLHRYRSALVKFGALTGQTAAFVGICERYGEKIRDLQQVGHLPGPVRRTPSLDVIERAIAVLKHRDERHFHRTGELRAYNVAARLQLETASRGISATERVTIDSLRPGNQIALVGKGGKVMRFEISSELYRTLALYLGSGHRTLALLKAYRSAFRRAILTVGGRVTGTHGIRRRAARDLFSTGYLDGLRSGLSPKTASDRAAGDAIQALGHSRNRRDHRRWYLGR